MADMTGAALPTTRRDRLLALLDREESLRVSDLSGLLGVAPVTVRRDVAQLAEEGLVKRVHGGIVRPERDAPEASRERRSQHGAPPHPGVGAGMLVPSLDYYWPDIVRGAEEVMRARGGRVLLRGSSYDSLTDLDDVQELAATTGVAGVLLAPNTNSPRTPELLEWLRRSEIPTVLVERRVPDILIEPPIDSVVSDHALGARIAVRHLVDAGHRRIGLVTDATSPTQAHVRRGWLAALMDHALDDEEALDVALEPRGGTGFEPPLDEVFDKVLGRGVTALLVHADSLAIALVQHAQRRGVSVPGDLSVVAYDDEVAELFSPALTAVRPPRRAVGRSAAELLLARVADPIRPTHRVMVTPTLHVRDSTGPARSPR